HHQAPLIPSLRPAVNKKQGRAFAADDSVEAHAIGLHITARKHVAEARRQMRRARSGAGAAWRWPPARVSVAPAGELSAGGGGCRQRVAAGLIGQIVVHFRWSPSGKGWASRATAQRPTP